MATDTELRAASDAAYRWVDLLSDVRYWAEYAQAPDGTASRVDAATAAFAKLYQLRWELDRYGPTLDAEVDRLAAVSEGIVRHPDIADEPKSYASAHEAVKDIVSRAVLVLLEAAGLGGRELPDNWQQVAEQQLSRHWRRFAINPSGMRARIRRERVKLLPTKSAPQLDAPPPRDELLSPQSGVSRGVVKSDISLDARALAVFIEHRDWTKKKIATHLGCNEKSLCPERCPQLTQAIAAYKSHIDPDRRKIRGTKSSDGHLEAWEDKE